MAKRKGRPAWDAESVQALRKHLGMTQAEMAEEMGTRQQTISEWETGMYRPRGASGTLLTVIGERAGFQYETASEDETAEVPSGSGFEHPHTT